MIKNFRGFTLIEMMVAMFITATLFTTLFVSYRALFSQTGAVESHIVDLETAEALMNRLSIDLKSMFIPLPPFYDPPDMETYSSEKHLWDGYSFKGEKETIGGKTMPKLTFSSMAHVSDDENSGKTESCPARIMYYVKLLKSDAAGGEDVFVVKRSDKPFRTVGRDSGDNPENAADPVVASDISSMDFKFMDKDGTLRDEWNSELSETGYGSPRAVYVSITVGEEEKQFETAIILPVMRLPKNR